MPAPTGYPSWVYNQAQNASQIVATLAAFNALGGAGTWTTTPFAPPGTVAPFDPGFITTDARLQQMVVEMRVTNQLLQMGLNVVDDPMTQ